MRKTGIFALFTLAACSSSPADSSIGDAGGKTNDSAAQVDGGSDATTPSADSGGKIISPPEGGAMDFDQVAPTPPSDWVSVSNNLAGMSSECGNQAGVFPDPHTDRLITGIALDGLWASTDGAQTWQAIGTSGDKIENRMSAVVFDPTTASTFSESGIYGSETGTDGVFVTKDNGISFTGFASLAALQQTADSVSIDFGDPNRKTLLSGGHEETQTLFLSTDSGSTWTNIGKSLPANVGFCTYTLVLDSQTFLAGCANSYDGIPGAIVRSTDGGMSWAQVDANAVIGAPLWASDGTVYWAGEGGGVYKSTNSGQTWTQSADSSTAGTVPPIELPDGRIVSAQNQNLVISADHDGSWTTFGSPMPYQPVGLSYSPFRSSFYIWYFSCTGANAVPSDSIERFGWDYRTN